MAKSGQKRKKADKAKVQLKTKRQADIKLPKGQNVTKAEVKTKTIVVQSQVKKADETTKALTKKKLGLKDVLAKTSNLSTSTKVDGLEGLMELVQDHPEVVEANSSLILGRLLPMLTEREGKVRNPAIKILQAVCQSVCLEPLYEVVSVHLCCALSHIDIGIQFGALRLLDTVIDHLPDLVRRHSGQILPNCVNQIATGAKLDSAGLNDSVSNAQRRTEVICRIAKLLRSLVPEDSAAPDLLQPPSAHKFDTQGSNFFGLYRPINDLGPVAASNSAKGSQLDTFILGTIPVLLEVWKECVGETDIKGGNKRGKRSGRVLLENVDLLCYVTEALTLICKITGGDCKAKILDEVVRKLFPLEGNVAVNMNLCALYLSVRDGGDDDDLDDQMVDYVAGLLNDTSSNELKRHVGVATQVALALDKNHVLIQSGLLNVKHPLVDQCVCDLVKRDDYPPGLVTHLSEAVLSRWASVKHCDAVVHLSKTRGQVIQDGLMEALCRGDKSLDHVTKQEVCMALAVALRSAPADVRAKVRSHVSQMEAIDEYSMAFCVNTVSV